MTLQKEIASYDLDKHSELTWAQDSSEIRSVIIQLLEQLILPANLHKKMLVIRQHLQEARKTFAWTDIQQQVIDLVNDLRCGSQQDNSDFQQFLQQMTANLSALHHDLEEEERLLSKARICRHYLGQAVNEHIASIYAILQEKVELGQLLSTTHKRVSLIKNNIATFEQEENQRSSATEQQLQQMKTHIKALEQETQQLHGILAEKNKQALLDTLTGIPNRLALDQRMAEEYSRWKRFSLPLTVVLWDIDFFKRINDTYGHQVGDSVLKMVAGLLVTKIRETDFVARYGGEEFYMLLPGNSEEVSLALAEKLRRRVEETVFQYHDQAILVTISCGIAGFCLGDTTATVFELADQALYRAKRAGRNRCEVAQR